MKLDIDMFLKNKPTIYLKINGRDVEYDDLKGVLDIKPSETTPLNSSPDSLIKILVENRIISKIPRQRKFKQDIMYANFHSMVIREIFNFDNDVELRKLKIRELL